MLVFEENKPNCDDNHRNQTISKRLDSFLKRRESKKVFYFRNLVSPFP